MQSLKHSFKRTHPNMQTMQLQTTSPNSPAVHQLNHLLSHTHMLLRLKATL
ncbi:hypothetical protein DDB_G0275219 [Dictyostelium discoideum AX4]|uniref:Uncharacterized protein n=1 Tax=Dictyostelium discoideum TaxID=44689 RepID=Q554I0_DICDI|nr:hypothetical protein DDB_G0275219 [Dictyostelium discoideum AX4]EAL69890.1 hypothetical protein DDB_G0275219 [Dictyostelium discoideum AX4]|eukprot:XP_643731.1 hypothetical protein DDB_G0275219 [Dictyostelium discoideum AX4]